MSTGNQYDPPAHAGRTPGDRRVLAALVLAGASLAVAVAAVGVYWANRPAAAREVELQTGNWVLVCRVTGRGAATYDRDGGGWTGAALDALAEQRGVNHATRTLTGMRVMFACGGRVAYGTVSRVDYATQRAWLDDCVIESRR